MDSQDAQTLNVEYEIQLTMRRDTVWIHASDGSTVARFGRMGIDLHNTVADQMKGMPQCRLCTYGRPSHSEWKLFREKAFEWWGVEVADDAFNLVLLVEPEPKLPLWADGCVSSHSDGSNQVESRAGRESQPVSSYPGLSQAPL